MVMSRADEREILEACDRARAMAELAGGEAQVQVTVLISKHEVTALPPRLREDHS